MELSKNVNRLGLYSSITKELQDKKIVKVGQLCKMKKIELSEHFNYKKLLRFTMPSILSMVFMYIFSVIDDGVFISNFVGKDAFVAINIVAPVLTIVGAIAYMIGTGGSAIVAKTLGEKEDKKVNEYFSMIVYFSIIVAEVLATIVSIIFFANKRRKYEYI